MYVFAYFAVGKSPDVALICMQGLQVLLPNDLSYIHELVHIEIW